MRISKIFNFEPEFHDSKFDRENETEIIQYKSEYFAWQSVRCNDMHDTTSNVSRVHLVSFCTVHESKKINDNKMKCYSLPPQ